MERHRVLPAFRQPRHDADAVGAHARDPSVVVPGGRVAADVGEHVECEAGEGGDILDAFRRIIAIRLDRRGIGVRAAVVEQDAQVARFAAEHIASLGRRGADAVVEKVVDAITQAANTNKIGDGKIFVMDLESVMRIRTGEKNEAALST